MVPGSSVEAYKNYWTKYSNIIKALPEPFLDGESYTNSTDTEDADFIYTRTFNNDAWQPLYIPFSMEYSEWADWADVAEIYGVSTVDVNENGVVDEDDITRIEYRTKRSGALKPNTPYVIRAKEAAGLEYGKAFTKTFEGKTLYAAEEGMVDCCSVFWKYEMKGVYEPYSDMVGKYALANGEFQYGTAAGQTLSPQRFYLEVTPRNGGYGESSAQHAPARIILAVDGEVTNIEGITIAPTSGEAFNLQGLRVTDGYKGIVIKNGKKTIVK